MPQACSPDASFLDINILTCSSFFVRSTNAASQLFFYKTEVTKISLNLIVAARNGNLVKARKMTK